LGQDKGKVEMDEEGKDKVADKAVPQDMEAGNQVEVVVASNRRHSDIHNQVSTQHQALENLMRRNIHKRQDLHYK
jgi:hypothetical protein